MTLRTGAPLLVLTAILTMSAAQPTDARAGETVVVVVEDLMLPEIQSEVDRLRTDIQARGFATKLKPWNLTTDGGTEPLWNYLKSEYGSSGSLHGAILIGNLPRARNSSNDQYTDLVYWNMTSTYGSTFTRNIWVSRMCALQEYGQQLPYGDEVTLLKRALNANHDYRTGVSRLPHSVYHYDSAYPGAAGNMNNALTIWPYVEYLSPHLAFQRGCELIHEESHGSSSSYNEGNTSTSSVHDFLAQARFVNVSSCSSGAFGGVVNNQILTRGGGNVFSVGASTTAYSGQIILMQDTTADINFRARLAAGDTWGQAYLKSFPYTDYYRLIFYGDLSIPAKAAPANQLPVVTDLVADKTQGAAPLTVSFTGGAASDPDGSIALYEWFPTGHRFGTAVPEYAGTSPKPPVSHTYTLAHRYKPRLEVADNYKARAWKAVQVTVAPEPGKPVRVNCGYNESYYKPELDYTDGAGDVWMHDQTFGTGTWGYAEGGSASSTAAVNGTADDVLFQNYRSGSSITYRVPVACGSYVLRLGFADMSSSAAGVRVIDVDVEGANVVSALDVYAQAGPKTAMQVQVPVVILDGELTLVVRNNAAATSSSFLNCFELLIADPNNGWPTVSSASPGSPLTMAAGDSQVFTAEVWDPDGDALTYKWLIDGATVPVTGTAMTYSPTAGDAGLHNIEVLADDGRGGIARKSWDVTVTAPTVTLSVYDAWAAEPSTDTGRFRVSRTGATTADLTVKYTVGGTAVNGTDYQSLGGTAVIPAGSSYGYVYVTPIDDTLVEGKESVTMTLLADPVCYNLGATLDGTVNLLDNELPTVTMSVSDAWASEPGADAGQFKISRTGATTASLAVNYAMSGTAANGADYTSLSGSAVIPVGAAYVYVDVAPRDDSTVEDVETVVLTIEEDASYQTGSTISGTVNLLDDEMPIITVAAADDAAAEPSNPGTFTVSRGGKTNVAVTVNYTMSGTATKGTDYATPSGTVTLASGATSATVTISPLDDTTAESRESVTLVVAANAAYQAGYPSSATLYLYDDEKPYVTVTATDAAAAEAGPDVGQYTIACLPAPKSATTIAYTMSGTATNGVDYVELPGTVTVAAGTATKVITLTPLEDGLSEGTESARLTLASGTGYQVGTPSNATVNIANGAMVAPGITTQPANRTVTVGQTATFSVGASGTAPLSYQWYRNGSAIGGATSSSYTTPATTTADNGAKFKVTVTNSAGSATSNEATLTVNAVPTYTITASAGTGGTISPSGAVVVSQGASQTFTITPSGGYQIAGVTVDGASVGAVPSYSFTNVTANHTISATFSAVVVPPSITTQPANRTVTVGQTATFSVGAAGTAPLSYQWYKNGAAIGGATSSSYTTPATTTADNGAKFKVTVTNSAGSATSNEATLTVNAVPTYTITASAGTGGTISPSGAVVVSQGASQAFTITPSGGYQIAGVTVDGASAGAVSTYTFSNVTANHTIAASFSAVAVPPSITTQPANRTVTVGQTATFSVVATGTAPLSYQWYKNGVAVSGATSASYTTSATTAADNGAKFKVTVTNSAGSATSSEATLTVTVPTYTITASAGVGGTISPTGAVAVSHGASQTFTIAAGAGYQIAGVTVDGVAVGAVSSYTFSNVTANHTIAATFGTAAELYACVSGIDLTVAKQAVQYTATGVVSVVDQSGAPVVGAAVTVEWSGAVKTGTTAATTDADGRAVFVSGKTKSPGPFTLTVIDVVAGGLPYDPTKNVVTTASATY